MEAEAGVYESALRRIYRGMKWLACAGALAGLCFKGWLWALAFLLGAAASYLNFSWLDQIVAAIGPNASPPRKLLWVFLGLRYVLLGGAGYVIVRVFGMNALAAVIGLFVPIASVFLETLYELVHART
jgi:ATP synthase I chain